MRRTLDNLAMPEGGDQERPKRRQLLGVAAGLLLATLAFSVDPAVAVEDAAFPTLAQIPEPDTNPPSRDECRKLSADAQVRTLDD
jgi:hypothetical protein